MSALKRRVDALEAAKKSDEVIVIHTVTDEAVEENSPEKAARDLDAALKAKGYDPEELQRSGATVVHFHTVYEAEPETAA